MNLIDEYVSNINEMKLSLDDFGEPVKVKNSNKLADRNVEIVALIESEQNELKADFLKLLDSSDLEVRGWAAHHAIERMSVDKRDRLKALKVIEDEAENHPDSTMRLGNKMWLKDYYEKHPEDNTKAPHSRSLWRILGRH